MLLMAPAIARPGLAQGQVGDPPRQAQQDTVAKRQTLPPLALPDIVIFGRSTATAREGSKLFPAGKRTVLDREIGAPVGEKGSSRTGWGGGRMLAALERSSPGRWARAYLRGGTYGELIAGGDCWTDLNRWQLLAHLGTEGTRGHVPNSSSLGGRGRLSAIYDLGPGTEVRLRAGYGAGRQEEWGLGAVEAEVDSFEVPAGAARTWFDADYALELEGMVRRGLTFRGGIGGRSAGLEDDVRELNRKPSCNGSWVEVGLEWLTGGTIVALSGRSERDRMRGPALYQDARLTSGQLTARALLGEASSILAGAVWYRAEAGAGLEPVTRLWPLAEFTSQYSDRFSMYVRYQPRIDYMTLGEAREQSPFVANSYTVIPREERFHLAIGLQYTVAQHVTVGFDIVRRQFDRLPVWRLAPEADTWSRGLFILDVIGSVGVNETRLSLEGTPGDKLVLNAELILRDPSGGSISELPHVPRLQFSGSVDGRGPWNLELGVRLTHLGERFGFGETDRYMDHRLAPATDLSVRIARGFGELLTAWLEFRNVLDQKVALWEGYLLPGQTSAFGLSIRF